MSHIYKTTDLIYRYKNDRAIKLPNLQIKAGDIVGISGLNGSGKSTLLKLLAFLLFPSDGGIEFFANQVTKNNHHLFRRQVTLLLQEPILLQRSVVKNIAYGLRLRGQICSAREVIF